MRPVAHTILIVCCLTTALSSNCPAEEHRSWKVIGQVKIEHMKKNLGSVQFRPELSLEENNRILASYRSQTTSLVLTISADGLEDLTSSNRPIVNRTVQLKIDDRNWHGRVSAVMISPAKQATLFTEFNNYPQSNADRLSDEETGVLSIGE